MDQAQALAERSAAALWDTDRASQGLGIERVSIMPGRASMAMTVRADMANGHGICHGGFLFLLADTAFAFACNSGGEATVAASGQIDFLEAVRVGERLVAEASLAWERGRQGIYNVEVRRDDGSLVALFRGRSHRVGSSRTSTLAVQG